MASLDGFDGEAPSLSVHVLGDLEVLAGGQPVVLPPSKKTRALLAYLACVGRAQRRERLCEMFWEIPDDPRGALRWSLSKIRQIVGGELEADRNSVQLRCRNVSLDLHGLKGLTPAAVGGVDTGLLEAAAGRFRGPFLADLSLPRCPDFEGWRVAMADEVELLHIEILRTLVGRLGAEPQRALGHARALASLLPGDAGLAERIAMLSQAARQAAPPLPAASPPPAAVAPASAPLAEPAVVAAKEEIADAGTGAVPAPSVLEQARLQVSVLAIDLVSPAQVFDSVDPEAGLAEIEPVQRDIESVMAKYAATVLELGNGQITAAFGVEGGTEDHAFFACRAALEAKRLVESASADMMRLRAGIDTGEVVARRRNGGWELSGAVPRQARRLAGLLTRGGVVMTDRARAAAGGYVLAEREDGPGLAGLGRDETVWRLSGENKAQCRWHMRAHRFLNRLIGREAELVALDAAWRKAREGEGVVVGVVAEPGIGKSRLTHEFCGARAAQGASVVEYGALEPDRQTSYLTIRRMVQGFCHIDARTGADEARERLARIAASLAIDGWHLPALEFLLELRNSDDIWAALSPAERLRRIGEAVKCLVGAAARRAPMILLFEDVHWMDAESDAVMQKLAEAAGALPLLMVATFRPSYEAAWLGRVEGQLIRLNRFSATQMGEIIEALVGADASLAALRHALARQSDGTPLFVEEAVRALSDAGRIAGTPGSFRAAGQIGDLLVPSTIQSVISARIGRLPAAQKRLLLIASVIGKDLPGGLLRKMSPLDDAQHEAALKGLLDAEFLYEVQSYPFVEYTMKHALTRRVAYEMLMVQDRAELHGRVLALLEARHAKEPEAKAETLAEHATKARQWDKAVRYQLMAARKALALSNASLAASWLDQAAFANAQLPDSPVRRQQAADIAKLARALGPQADAGAARPNSAS